MNSSCPVLSNANSKKIIFDYDLMMTSSTPYDTHHGVVTNRAKFDASTSSTFIGVKTDRHTDRIALYSIDICLSSFQKKVISPTVVLP